MENTDSISIAEDDAAGAPRPRVVIVGGGFGGLAAAKALRKARVRVTLIDRANHHLFQPLLYQVATAELAPSQISSPIRGVLRRQKNAAVIMGEVTGLDKSLRTVFVNSPEGSTMTVAYDYLILATGVHHSYFGHNEFEEFAPGLKGLGDALAIRNKILSAFEEAEAEANVAFHQELLTFVLVGGGPTGVEMAAALAVMVRSSFRSEFRRIDPASARIVLVDAGHAVLKTFAPGISEAAKKRLQNLGVEVRLGNVVQKIDDEGVVVGGERILSKTVIWTAGVAPSPAGKWLGVETDRAGRVRVKDDLSVPGNPEVFTIGDTASLDQDGKPLPGVAQVAIQQGRYVGKLISGRLTGRRALKPFRYFDKGNMAVVGKGFAVVQTGPLQMHGLTAWFAWAFIHITYLGQLNLKMNVLLQWAWLLVTGQRGSGLIVNHQPPEPPTTPATINDTPQQSTDSANLARR